jgi:hypothetical protein
VGGISGSFWRTWRWEGEDGKGGFLFIIVIISILSCIPYLLGTAACTLSSAGFPGNFEEEENHMRYHWLGTHREWWRRKGNRLDVWMLEESRSSFVPLSPPQHVDLDK